MSMPDKLRAFLKIHAVQYRVHTHRPAFTAQEVAAAEHVPGREVAKVVMVRAGDAILMAVLPAPHHVDLDRLGRAVGRTDLRLAKEEEFVGLFPGCDPGAMPPFGNLYDVPVWVEESLTRDREIVFNAGNHEQTVRMAYDDFARLVRPKVAFFRTGVALAEAG
jgi:Ala-tRNA(Pro) deacylase